MTDTLAHLGNAALFGGLLLVFTGALDSLFSSDDDTPTPTPTSPTGSIEEPPYTTEDFAEEVQGTADADTVTAAEEQEASSFFLLDGDDALTATSSADYADGGAGDDELSLGGGRTSLWAAPGLI